MHDKYQKLIKYLGETKVIPDEPLSKYTSFRIGGPADLFFKARTVSELVTAIKKAKELKMPYFVLGGGTNTLVSDRGFRGLVVKNETNNIRLKGIKGNNKVQFVYLEVESGVSINRLVRFTLDEGLAGLEYFLGQPGTVGGAVYINAHNINKNLFFGDKIIEAEILNSDGEIKTVDKNYFHFSYDQSVIQDTKETVLKVLIELKRGDREKLWQEAQKALNYRRITQPTGIYSAGCTFRNISKADALRLAAPNYTTSAGYFLESCGLKGVNFGRAQYSPHHANFIIHKGGVCASDVLELIRLAKEKVKQKYHLDLREEIVLMGDC